MPKVSVLIPLYKTTPSHLREAIGSILDQSFTDFELLLLDDAPEDDRAAVVAEFTDPRIRYTKNATNLGIAPTRNKLVDMAQGEYLAIMDHDDISLPERFAMQVAYLDEHPEVGVVSGRVQLLGSSHTSHYPADDAEIRLSLISGCALVHTAAMIRKSVLSQSGLRYEERYSPCEDYALWCKLIPHTRFHNLSEVICHYRDHNNNTSHRQKRRMQKITATIWARVRSRHPEHYQEFLMRATHNTRIKLFGFIPFLKITTRGNRQWCKLFGFIPLYQKRFDIKLHE